MRLVLRYDSVWFSFGMFFFRPMSSIFEDLKQWPICLQGDVSATCRADIDYQIRIVWYACDVCKPQRLWNSEKWLRGTPGLLLVITGHYWWLPVMSNGRMQWFSKVEPKLQIQAAQDWFSKFVIYYLKFREIVIYRSQVQKTLDLSSVMQDVLQTCTILYPWMRYWMSLWAFGPQLGWFQVCQYFDRTGDLCAENMIR